MSEDGFSAHVGKGSPAPPDPIAYLSEHGYTQVHSYQPDSRYWTFQWIELGWLVLVSVVLLGTHLLAGTPTLGVRPSPPARPIATGCRPRRYQGVQAPWYVWAFWAVVVACVLSGWVFFGGNLVRALFGRRNSSRVARLAAEHGWCHSRSEWLTLRPGAPFTGSIGPATDVLHGTLRGTAFTAFEYDHESQVFMLELPSALPYLEVRPRGLEGQRPLLAPSVTLESEAFNLRYWVHAEDAKFASDVLHPRLMQRLLSAPPLCWRILGQDLVGWWPGELDPGRVSPAVWTLIAIKDSVPGFVWQAYVTPAGPAA